MAGRTQASIEKMFLTPPLYDYLCLVGQKIIFVCFCFCFIIGIVYFPPKKANKHELRWYNNKTRMSNLIRDILSFVL